MFKIDITDEVKKFTLQSDEPIYADSADITSIIALCNTLSLSPAGVISVEMNRVGASTNDYTYIWTALNNRIWKQEITFNNELTFQTFDEIVGQWQLSEFVEQRIVRDALIFIARTYKLKFLKYERL